MSEYKWVIIEDYQNYVGHGFAPNLIEGGIAGFIYNVDGGFIYDSNWNEVIIDYIPKEFPSELKSSHAIPYNSFEVIKGCLYGGYQSLYFPKINKVYDLSIEVNPIDLIFNRDEFLLNDNIYAYKYGYFISDNDTILPKHGVRYENMVSFTRNRLNKMRNKIRKICKNIDG